MRASWREWILAVTIASTIMAALAGLGLWMNGLRWADVSDIPLDAIRTLQGWVNK